MYKVQTLDVDLQTANQTGSCFVDIFTPIDRLISFFSFESSL